MKFCKYEKKVNEYMVYLAQEERSKSARKQYLRDILAFLKWADKMEVEKDVVICYKDKLQANYKTTSVNVKLAAINGFFSYIGRTDLKVKQLKIQRKAYCTGDKELTKGEYWRLIETAKKK